MATGVQTPIDDYLRYKIWVLYTSYFMFLCCNRTRGIYTLPSATRV